MYDIRRARWAKKTLHLVSRRPAISGRGDRYSLFRTSSEERAAAYVAEQFRSLGYAVVEEPFRFLGWSITAGKPDYPDARSPWNRGQPFHLVRLHSCRRGRRSGRKRLGGMNIIELFEWDKFAITDTKTGEGAGLSSMPPATGHGQSVSMTQASSTFTNPVVTVGKRGLRTDPVLVKPPGRKFGTHEGESASFKPGTRSRNIIAKLPGKALEKGIVLCAHYDSQYNTAGAYDNASSVGLILEQSTTARGSFSPPDLFHLFRCGRISVLGACIMSGH